MGEQSYDPAIEVCVFQSLAHNQCLTVVILDVEMTTRSMDEVYVILINCESFDECDPEKDHDILPDKHLPVLSSGPRTWH